MVSSSVASASHHLKVKHARMNLSRKRLTIKDVAAAAGVSTQTVSRVINERPDVADATRVHVTEVIAQLGYRPNALARSMIRRRSHTLGVVTAGLKYIGPSRVLHGITDAAEQEGYGLLLEQLPSFGSTAVAPLLDRLLERQVEGVIWAVPEVGDNHAWLQQYASRLGVPVVITSTRQQPDTYVVTIDNYEGGQMATRHLIEEGYRHIGHISGPLDWWEAQQRKAAWQDVLAGAGLPASPEASVEGNWSSRSGLQAAERLLAQYSQMDAVFAGNDQMALSVLQLAAARGLRVPDQLGVIGFDGIPEAPYFWPALSTIDQDQHRLGSSAVHGLLRLIHGDENGDDRLPGNRLVLQPSLIVRASSQRLLTAELSPGQ
jgi:DNA-binding LacI/PurR family transcriptional regulator